ncbi:MAG: PEF-CTERM sorting domain-containing protein, partial [Candidatus Thermoplasmatota archaeon]|nr:PEF-CTERM sorting domain-containing protein [Candidatus Thermoplasmatota archaeon]
MQKNNLDGSGSVASHGMSNASVRKNPGEGKTNDLSGRTNGMTNGMGGKTNGITNGMGGRTNGMTNGLGGKTNGLTNGMGGRTNGITNGMTNGLDGSVAGRRRLDDRAISPSRISLVLIVAFIVMIPASFFFLAYNDPAYSGIRVDGDFSDWNDSLFIADGNTYPVAGLDIVECSADTNDAGNLFVYARAGGTWFSSANADSLFVFIDADANPSTGYAVDNSGAEYAVEIYGWDSAIRGRQFGMFSGQDLSNWSAWNWRSATAQISGDRMEIGIPGAGISLTDGYTLTFMTKRGSEFAEICDATISPGKGALVVKQIPLDINGVISQDHSMNIEITAKGTAVNVTDIGFFSNAGIPTVTGLPTQIPAGQTVTLQVSVPIGSLTNGSFVDMSVTSITCTGTANVLGTGLTAYAKAAPGRIIIDGAFGDWNAVTKTADPAGDIDSPNNDIAEYAAVNSTSEAFFYLKVDDAGEIMGGSSVPGIRVKTQAGSGTGNASSGGTTTPAPLKRVSGEDVTRIYIDTISGGPSIGGINADYMVEIKGKNGEISSRKLYTVPNMTLVGNIDAACRENQLEAGLDLSQIEYNGTLQYFVESTDWQGNQDRTATASTSTVGGTRSSLPEPNPLATLDFSQIPELSNSITIDGVWNTFEWNGAEIYSGTNFNLYVWHNGVNLYVGFLVSADTLAHTADSCTLYFDYGNDKTAGAPDASDKKFLATDTTASGTTNAVYDGSGGNWDTTTTSGFSADASLNGTLNYIIYEFSIPLSEVFATTTSGSEVGFAAHIYNADTTTNYYWGESTGETTPINPLNLSTWGTLEIPEFHLIMLPILAILGMVFALGRKKEEDDEKTSDDEPEADEEEEIDDSEENETEELDDTPTSTEPPKISNKLLIIGTMLLATGIVGVIGLRLGFIQALLGNTDIYPGIGSVEPMGHVVSMVPFVLGLVTVAFWGIKNDPIYHEIEKAQEELAEEIPEETPEDIFEGIPDDDEPEEEDEAFEWEATQDTVPEEFNEPIKSADEKLDDLDVAPSPEEIEKESPDKE